MVAENAAAYALSFAKRAPVSTNSADTIADGMACRVPDAGALEIIRAGAERIVTVSEAAIRAAMRHYFTDTHNVAEGAGRSGKDRLRFYRHAYASARECRATLDVAAAWGVDLDAPRATLDRLCGLLWGLVHAGRAD